MAKGGARGRSGPPPDPNSLTSADGEWTVLPAAGRSGDAPVWPLAMAQPRELELWESEWARPQAVMWAAQGQELEVAMYVRSLVEAEVAGAAVALRTLVKQLQEALGLSMPGLLRNRWRIADVEPSTDDADSDEGLHADDVRGRLTVVAGGGA